MEGRSGVLEDDSGSTDQNECVIRSHLPSRERSQYRWGLPVHISLNYFMSLSKYGPLLDQ